MIAKRATYRIAAAIFIASLAVLGSILITRNAPRKILLTTEEKAWLARNYGKIRAGGDPAYPPVDFLNQSGEHDGISEDVLRLAESRLGFSFRRVRTDDWGQALNNAKNGTLDLLYAASPTAEREEFLTLTSSYIEMPTVFAALDSNDSVRSVKDLEGKRVAITKDYSSYDYFKEHNPGFTIVGVQNDFEALLAVAAGEVDAALSDIPVISYHVEEKCIPNLRIIGESGYVHQLSFAVRKDMPELLGLMNKALDSISPRDRQRIIDRWIDVEYRNAFYESRTWVVLASIIAAAATVVLLAGLWDKALRSLVRSRTRELVEYKARLEDLVTERTHELEESNRALEEAIRALEVLAQTDTLTGCANRRAFLETAAREHARFERFGAPYTLIEFDFDHFKRVNDTYGHAAGDLVLRVAAGSAAAQLRESDLLARVGGEEFFVLLPSTGLNEALATAERLRKTIEEIKSVRWNDEEIRFSASFGVSEARPGDSSEEEAMNRADRALYRAKDTGRNRVVAE